MIINIDQKQMQMEQRDVNYILPAYIRNYLFQSKNIDPEEIVFPMFSSVPHPRKVGVTIPIRWVPEISPEAMEISVDGASVAEATEEEIAVKDEQDDMRKETKAGLGLEPVPEADVTDGLTEEEQAYEAARADLTPAPEEVSPARAAFADVAKEEPKAEPQPTTREIKGPPSGPILPPGTPLDNMAPRDRGDQTRVAKDLRPEPDIDESKEIETSIEKPEEE